MLLTTIVMPVLCILSIICMHHSATETLIATAAFNYVRLVLIFVSMVVTVSLLTVVIPSLASVPMTMEMILPASTTGTASQYSSQLEDNSSEFV